MAGTAEIITDDPRIDELTTRGIAQIYPSPDELSSALRSGKQLSVYLGIDPTAPDLHVGHVSHLHRMHTLQELGHKVFLLIGDFTGRIGDPTDKSAARVRLTEEQVQANAAGYRQQAGKILDFEHPTNPVRLVYNSEWLGSLTFADVIDLSSEVTVQQMLERDMFKNRINDEKPLWLHEILYPVMQGYDAVRITPEGVDIELGGSDQIFNMLVGADYVRRHHGKQKYVVAGQLLADPSGKKIGKSEGNMVTVNDVPLDMYHKAMLWGDEITPHALELSTRMPMSEIAAIRASLANGELSGTDGKKILANQLVTELHGADAARQAARQYSQLIERSEDLDPTIFNFEEHVVKPGKDIISVLLEAGLAPSKNEARRLLQQNGVYVNETPVSVDWTVPEGSTPLLLRRGRRSLDNYRKLTPSTVREKPSARKRTAKA